jgi:hypothetical protein
MDGFDIVAEDIFFRHWRVGRKPDDMPATTWDEVVDLLGQCDRDLDDELAKAMDNYDADHAGEVETAEERGYERGLVERESDLDEAFNAGARSVGVTPSRLDHLKERLRRARK